MHQSRGCVIHIEALCIIAVCNVESPCPAQQPCQGPEAACHVTMFSSHVLAAPCTQQGIKSNRSRGIAGSWHQSVIVTFSSPAPASAWPLHLHAAHPVPATFEGSACIAELIACTQIPAVMLGCGPHTGSSEEGAPLLHRYMDGGRVRPIAHRMSMAEIIVPYGDPRNPFQKKCAFDIVDYGLGFCANSLELGCDCLGHIKYFDGMVNNSRGEAALHCWFVAPRLVKDLSCCFETGAGVRWCWPHMRPASCMAKDALPAAAGDQALVALVSVSLGLPSCTPILCRRTTCCTSHPC